MDERIRLQDRRRPSGGRAETAIVARPAGQRHIQAADGHVRDQRLAAAEFLDRMYEAEHDPWLTAEDRPFELALIETTTGAV
ncbi:MAG TPA: hypothetical protein VIV06_08810 [Candidatus Limnocylindrales bacterium]